jgi:hypothetical protein
VGAILVIGALVIGFIIVPIVGFFTHTDTAAPITPGHRGRRIIGFAIVAAAVSIPFFPVKAPRFGYYEGAPLEDCGTGWHALFYNQNTTELNNCGPAASPLLWIAGGVAAVGIGVAFWDAGRGRLLGMISVVLVVTLFLAFASYSTSQQMGN